MSSRSAVESEKGCVQVLGENKPKSSQKKDKSGIGPNEGSVNDESAKVYYKKAVLQPGTSSVQPYGLSMSSVISGKTYTEDDLGRQM